MPVAAIRFHRGRRKFSQYAEVKKEMAAVHQQVIKPQFVREFDKIVHNWATQLTFGTRLMQNPDGLKLYVFPQGSAKAKQIWWWNVLGTKAHEITAKNAPTLVFEWGGPGSYMPKTGPGGAWFGGPGKVSGGAIIRPLRVWHPGTAPRPWPEIVRNENKVFYSREVENAWRRALRRINRG